MTDEMQVEKESENPDQATSENGSASLPTDSDPCFSRPKKMLQESSHPSNPLEQSSLWSRIFFLWAYPLVRLGKERPLEDLDLPTLAKVDSSIFQATHLDQLRKVYTTDDSSKDQYLGRILFLDYWKRTRRARWLLVGNIAARLVQTVALGRVLRLFEQKGTGSIAEGYAWAALLVACGLVSFPTKQQQFFETYRVG